jgi:hypothetical protein
MPRADLVTGLVFALLGLAGVWASLDMPRFEDRNINPYTIPGLVPGALGVIILGLGVVLFTRAALAGGWRFGGLRLSTGPDVRRLILALVLCLVYAAGLVGQIPFWLATFVFVALFVILFEWQGEGGHLWRIAVALVYGAAVSAVVTLVFQELFLIRLP